MLFKLTTLLIFSVFFFSCSGQDIPIEVPYSKTPKTPSKEALDKLDLIPYSFLKIEEDRSNPEHYIKHHFLSDQAFNGWSYQEFSDSEHRYRYTKFENGLKVWQIGYFDNGELGHDFHMKDGKNKGSQQMWHKGGKPYIDTYSSSSD